VTNQYPTFIICRDRLTDLKELVIWLESVGQQEIYLVDNESTYEPLLEYYKQTPHEVIHMGGNTGQTGVWNCGVIDRIASGRRFIVTDPDVVPVEECPKDALEYFSGILDRYPDRSKVGFGLKLNDLPDHYQFKNEVIQFESRYYQFGGPEYGLHFAPIDTTFALYREGATQDISYSCRTSWPYEARHMAWYLDSQNITEEEAHYRSRMHTGINSWNQEKVPHWWY